MPTISIPTGTTALVMRPLPKSDHVKTSERRMISTGKFGRFGGQIRARNADGLFEQARS